MGVWLQSTRDHDSERRAWWWKQLRNRNSNHMQEEKSSPGKAGGFWKLKPAFSNTSSPTRLYLLIFPSSNNNREASIQMPDTYGVHFFQTTTMLKLGNLSSDPQVPQQNTAYSKSSSVYSVLLGQDENLR